MYVWGDEAASILFVELAAAAAILIVEPSAGQLQSFSLLLGIIKN